MTKKNPDNITEKPEKKPAYMTLTLTDQYHTVTIEDRSSQEVYGAIGDAIDMFVNAMAGLGYEIDSVRRCVMEMGHMWCGEDE